MSSHHRSAMHPSVPDPALFSDPRRRRSAGVAAVLVVAVGIAALAWLDTSQASSPPPSATLPASIASQASAATVTSSASPAPAIAAGPLTPAIVELRLRALDPSLTLAAGYDNDVAEVSDVFPRLTFHSRTPAETLPRIRGVLVYPTAVDRKAVQDAFGPMQIIGSHGLLTWDGVAHSEWIGVENVLVEVVMPGGSFGGRSPTPADDAYPSRVRTALALPLLEGSPR